MNYWLLAINLPVAGRHKFLWQNLSNKGVDEKRLLLTYMWPRFHRCR